MKKLFIFLSIFILFTIDTLAYVDFDELPQDGTYAFTDDFTDVKLKKNYVIWETPRELAIVTSDSDIYIYEHALSYYLGCKGQNCKEVIAYKYQKNSKGQYVYSSKSDKYIIKYNMNTERMQKVWSTSDKVSYKLIFTDLTTYYSNNPIKEKYTNFDLPKKELPRIHKNKLVGKRDVLDDIAKGFDSLFGGLGRWFNDLFNILDNIKESILSIPQLIIDGILDGLKALFIPSDNFFKEKFDNFNSKIANAFNLDISKFNVLNSGSKELDSFTFDYMNTKVTLLDKEKLNKGLELVRPYIQGFFYLLILLYNLNQFLSLFGQSKSTEGGSTSDSWINN